MYHSKKAATEQHAATTKKPKRYSKQLIYSCIAQFFIILLIFHAKDFIFAAVTGKDSYALKHQTVGTVSDGQQIWQLFRNGEYLSDVNPNDYMLLDSSGNTDFKYCTIIHEARNLAYSVILTAMLVLVLLIADNSRDHTPFTKNNARRIKAIGYLQFSLAIVPGLLEFILKAAKFEYLYLPPRIESLYMLVIGFAIFMIGKIFDRGVSLQDENDLIA